MAKRRRKVLASDAPTKRRRRACSKHEEKHSSIDRISLLSDELLGIILSHLTIKQATRTSILSRRWKIVWTLTCSLDFDGVDSLVKLGVEQDNERNKYVGWVNNAIASCNNSTFKDFKVNFDLTRKHQESIDEWISHALKKKVETLELKLTTDATRGHHRYGDYYVFPNRFLQTYEENCPNNSLHFKQLQKICLTSVDVNSEALEFFLHNCPLLRDVSVSDSSELRNVRIVGPLPSLKRFEVRLCCGLNLVEIRDVDLVSFKYGGHSHRVQFLMLNVPMLVDVSVEEDIFVQFSSILPQLEILKICIVEELSWLVYRMLSPAKNMNNLKQLVVNSTSVVHDLLPVITNLLRAAPCLEKFVLEMEWRTGRYGERKMEEIKNLYPQLKEVYLVSSSEKAI